GTASPPEEDDILSEVAAHCHCTLEELEDVYACTALQEGMMATTVKDPSAYTVEYEFHLAPGIDAKRLRDAWNRTSQANPILRTRIVPTSQRGVMQAVVKGPVPWHEESDDDGMPNMTSSVAWRAGAPLVYLTLHLTKHSLTMMIHHSICDDWSIALLLRQVDEAYRGQELVHRPFRPLVEYVQSTRTQAEAFWEQEFRDAHKTSMTSFPHIPTAGYVSRPTCQLEKTFDIQPSSRAGFTVNTKLRLAWAVLQYLYTGSDDTLFGTVNAGRGVSVPGVQELSGPAVATVPVRVRLCRSHTVAEALAAVQEQWAAMMQFEQVGLQNLLHLGPGPKAACQFQTLLSVEPRDGHQLPALFSKHQSTQRNYDLYALVLRCRPSSNAMWIEARFDPGVIDSRQTERILSQLAHIYEQIDEESDLLLSELDPRTDQQLQAPAISSWDGELSYQSLDIISSALAAQLSQYSVARGMFVPLCLGKSKWTAVTMLAVMKVGAAFVLLDPSYPVSRLRTMCETLGANVIVTSNAHASVASRLGVATNLNVDSLDLKQNSSDPFSTPTISPFDPVYATFTSGSTGNPKCVIVTHAGYASSALAHGEPYHFTPQSRILQFASPAFDSCIIEHLSTLIMGGCVCIPSAADCQSRLTEVINEFAVDVACLTPTVTRILSPSRMDTLKVLVFVGEAVLASDVVRWESHVQVRNAYGPAECSAVFSIQPHLQSEDPANIGFSTGGVGWVVNPEDHNRLMPLGCPGELVIEGLIVGNGYLSNFQQTSKVFIDAPPWRRRFGDAPSRQLYKTGDLVQHTGDGSFRYLGRKDTQVKLHGQRLELADIEHHLCHAFPLAEQAVAEMLRSSSDDGRPDALLVAFICFASSSPSGDDGLEKPLFLPPNAEFRGACSMAESRLSESLPSFMVPAIFFPISHVPLTPSGKTDRRYFREKAALLSWEQMQEYRAAQIKPQSPSGAREEQLQQIWAQTLNRPINQIGVNESFFRLGGDSVSAMQVAASCQAAGLNVMVSDIFRFPSISKLAQKIQESNEPQTKSKHLAEDATESWFGLSPIQQLFFEHVPDGHHRFTQEFLLHVTKPTPASKIKQAVEDLTTRHAMLRARFKQSDDGDWEQIVGKKATNNFQYREHQLSSIKEHTTLQSIFGDSQSSLNIEDGPMLVVDLIETETHEQYLGLMAHHLVIDLVSWRVLLQDLEDILTTGSPLQPASVSFQKWCHLQQAYTEESLDPETALSTDIPAAPLRYWGPPAKLANNRWADTAEQSIRLSQEVTQSVLGAANDAFHTRPVEIIQTAILYAFVQAFDNRPAPAIFSEGHGREPWDPSIEISRTVGWFTTIAPVFVRAKKGQGFTELLQLTKDGRRAIPRNGWAYFASRYLHPEGMNYCAAHSPMEILFNYTGLFQQLERPGALLQLQSVPDQALVPMPADLPRFALIDVTASVTDGCLNIAFVYNKHMKNQERLQQWVQTCQGILQEVPEILQQGQRLTVSDFPLLPNTTNEQLQELLHQISHQFDISLSNIEDIYPCSHIQLGMWLSHAKNPQMYWSHIRWIVHRSSSESPLIEISRIKGAWQQVVDRHPILRTVFTERTGEHSLQVVFKSSPGNIEVVSQDEASLRDDETLSPSSYQSLLNQSHLSQEGQTPHKLKLTIQRGGDVFCELSIHHMLVDGVTWQIFLSDFHRAYHGQLESEPTGAYSTYLRYLQTHHLTGSEMYWKQYLDGANACIFPSLVTRSPRTEPSALNLVPFSFEIARHLQSFSQHHGITISSLLQVAWGVVLRVYTGSDSVCFGYLNSCRDIPVPNARKMSGPLINLLICRLSLTGDASVLKTLLENQDAHARNLEHQHCSLAEVMHSLNLACQPLFNTAMSLQREAAELMPSDYPSEINLEGPLGIDSTEYDLTVNIIVGDEKISGDLTYWSHVVTDAQAELVSDTFFHVLSQLIDPSNAHMSQLDPLGPMSRDRLLQRNQFVPQAAQTCIHTDIQQYSRAHVTASAVCDTDGDMTYGQLDQASSILAQHLEGNGVGADVFVPVCCEKSRWVVVAVLAVLKAGGAFILLDPTHPAERLQGMVNQDFLCPVILASTKHVDLAASIVPRVLHIETDASNWTVGDEVVELPAITPRAAAYAVFTSGSTGKPKASVIEHQAFRSAAEAHSRALRLREGSRVLQFASYAFDASIVEILTTLLVGGCICIPNEIDRARRLSEVIQDMRVTWALLTPSVARILKPGQVSTLETLVLGGEGMSENDVRLWSSHVHLMNAYGPSECSVVATVQPSPQCLLKDPANIGFPVGCLAWVVDTQAPEKPMPIGAVGELLIEGPIVGRGYVNRPDHTKAAFLPYPSWLHHIRGTEQGSLYRTGDRARILEDGSIHYLGRKDRQVKLHGQRIELGEIEHQIRQCWPECDPLVFVDLVKPLNSTNTYLVASIVYLDENVKDRAFEGAVEETELRLQGRVPAFLIPSAFLPTAGVPRLPNGKVDRRRLCDEASRDLQIRMDQSEGSPKTRQRMETTKDEQLLQQLWAQVLHREVDSIGPDDNFFRLGGDSILVMKLASAAATQGLKLSVPDVFLHPRLKDLARLHVRQQTKPPETEAQESIHEEDAIPPLSLLPSAQRETAKRETMSQCDVTAEQIEDIYPCTALQAGLAALTAERPGSYIAHHYFKLAPNINLDRLKTAWERVSSQISILRTRLVQTEFGCLQAIIRDCELSWKVATGDQNKDQEPTWEMLFGQRLIHFEIDRKPEHIELSITVHHAVYDAWSLPLLLQWAQLAYDDLGSPKLRCAPFQRFIQYTMSQKEKSLQYWHDKLSSFDADPFPSIPFPSYRPQTPKKVQRTIATGPVMDGLVSRTTASRLAWALVQSQYQSGDTVVFGVVSSGRSAPVRGIEMMAGPTIATIPLSVSVDNNVTVSQALIDLQEQMLQLIPYEQVGLSQIASVGPGAMQACSFQTLLIEGRDEAHDEPLGNAQPLKTFSGDDAANTYVLELTIILGTDETTVEAAFDETVLPEWQIQRILDQFGHILQRVHKEPQRLVKEISTVNSRDLQNLKMWNREIPDLDSRTAIEVIRGHCANQPSAPAVCAWDGNLSYGELDTRSDTLARAVCSWGVGPDMFIPIYLDRSRWTAVAVLAVLKAGAAFVLLDTFHPHGRLRTICEELQAPIIITSINHQAAAQSLVSNTVVVTAGPGAGSSSEIRSPPANPHRALYAVFTSGSTGKPKAAVVENGSFATMAIPYAREMRLNKNSRMLHFASYAFDVSILEILGTLFIGSCVCVLSESERRDHLARAVTNLQPSHAILTPSVLRVVTPADLSSVHTIMLIGEPVRESDIRQWADKVHLLNTYGPAECTVVFTMKPSLNLNGGEAANIGVSIAGASWVTDPRDPQRLLPIGAVGELLLQGPLVGRGYLNNTQQTEASFIPCPSWMHEQLWLADDRDSNRRVYRTGDLVRYDIDGSLCFVGRRDYQVKLRGQRFELGEVESQVQHNFPADIEDVVAHIITPAGAVKNPCLAVFIALKGNTGSLGHTPSSLLPSLDVVIPTGFGEMVNAVKRRLEDVLPEYMIPTIFVPFKHLPRTTGGKLDRSRLRDSVAKVSRQDLDSMFMPKASDKRRNTATTTESTLQKIWAQALGIVADQIGVEDSFFRLGGDSISALQATSQARAVGIAHSVGDLFQWRTILQVAKRFAPSHELHVQQRDPNVAGVIPCTPAQRGILLNQMQFEHKYAAHFIWQVNTRGEIVDVDRLVKAWKAVVSRHSALRVKFQPSPSDDGQFEQVLLHEIDTPVHIIRDEICHDGVADDSMLPDALIEPSANVGWRNDGQSIPHQLTVHSNSSGGVFCRLDINHAILDGMSLAILELDLCHAYDAPLSKMSQPDPYREYINYVQKEPHDEARKYWESYLKDIEPLALPRARVPETASESSTDVMKRLEISLAFRGEDIESFCRSTDWTPSNLVYFAWALALSALTGSQDVCFAISTSGRLIPVPHIDRAVGQFSNMSICRARMASDLLLNDISLHMQQDYSQILSYQSFPLVEIARAAGVPIEALASTGVIVHYPLPAGMAAPLETASLQLTQRRVLDPGIHEVALYVVFEDDGQIRAALTYHPSRVSPSLATQLADYFDLAVSRILQHPDSSLGDLALLSDHDQQRLRSWNGALPSPVPFGIHEIIEERTKKQPTHQAVSSWDGEFTYSELDQLASQLAEKLQKTGIRAAQPIPLCFEKSCWTIVAILAVMKAGGTFVPLDAMQPMGRLQELCRRLNVNIIISSTAQVGLSRLLADQVIQVGNNMTLDHHDRHYAQSHFSHPTNPEQAAYILFTSGSTGAPKGVMVSHSSYTFSADQQIQAFSLNPSSRVLQASSYAFDVSMAEILTTLIAGATVCVVSDSEQNKMMMTGVCPVPVSHAMLTPSLASGLDATRASSWLQTLILIGEPVSSSHTSQWGKAVTLINSYGPTECAVYSTATSAIRPGDDPRNIGRPLGVHAWVVDKDDKNRLLPLGAVGELVLAGPAVGIGYLDEPEKTAEAFMQGQPPVWLRGMYSEQELKQLRLYKTGDLVRYEISDGSLRFEDRKDRQIKVRGQRVELEDIEHHVRRFFSGASEIVIEQVMLLEESYSDTPTTSPTVAIPRLVACIYDGYEDNTGTEQDLLHVPSDAFSSTAANALRQLRDDLPGYMIPDFFVSVAQLPRTVSGKTDKQQLSKAIQEIPPLELRAYFAAQRNKKPLETETAVRLHAILTGLLDIAPETVGADDSFFHLGGDSILAMKIAANARAQEMEISSHDVLRHPTIAEWAAIVDAQQADALPSQQYVPYSAVTEAERAAILSTTTNKDHPFVSENVVDILPAVGFQSYYVTHSSPVSTAQVFPMGVDIDRLRMACKRLMSHYSILRTVFVEIDSRIFQVILQEVEPVFDVVECDDPEAYITQESQRKISPSLPRGSLPMSFTVVTSPNGPGCIFILRISHAQYDGASLHLLWQALAAAYEGNTLPKAVQFSEVVYNRLSDTNDEAFSFWRKYLHDASAATLDFLRVTSTPASQQNDSTAVTSARREITRSCFISEITSSTLVKAALIWKLSSGGLHRDVIFGQVVHGRGCPIPNVDKALGPCINLLPLRVVMSLEWTIMDLLRHTQVQQLETLSYDYLSFEDIVRKCTDWPSNSKFGCIVHHQEADGGGSFEMGGIRASSSSSWANSKLEQGQVGIVSMKRGMGLDLMITATGDTLEQSKAELLADELVEAIQWFSEFPDRPLSELAQETKLFGGS
ncbi:hypothetical protein N7522_009266, partial [Penicillium canescens]